MEPLFCRFGVIDGFRWCLLGGEGPALLTRARAQCRRRRIFLWFGLRHRKMERSFADLI
jgi:homopolymeric O-antigen transport system permease protein